MNNPIKVMVTADQKRTIEDAAKAFGAPTAIWARIVLLKAAADQFGGPKDKPTKRARPNDGE